MSEKDDQMYVYQLFGVSTPRKIKATKDLRNKIGPAATIDEQRIIKAQRRIDKPEVDFAPYALEYISQIEDLVLELKMMGYNREGEYNSVTVPVSQLKGQAAMFGNPFVSEVSATILKFLEHYKRLDDDVIEILEAYCRCVRAAYEYHISSGDTADAQKLTRELNAALKRYVAKFRRRTEK